MSVRSPADFIRSLESTPASVLVSATSRSRNPETRNSLSPREQHSEQQSAWDSRESGSPSPSANPCPSLLIQASNRPRALARPQMTHDSRLSLPTVLEHEHDSIMERIPSSSSSSSSSASSSRTGTGTETGTGRSSLVLVPAMPPPDDVAVRVCGFRLEGSIWSCNRHLIYRIVTAERVPIRSGGAQGRDPLEHLGFPFPGTGLRWRVLADVRRRFSAFEAVWDRVQEACRGRLRVAMPPKVLLSLSDAVGAERCAVF